MVLTAINQDFEKLIPQELIKQTCFLNWKVVVNDKGKQLKAPVDDNGRSVSYNDPSAMKTLEQALIMADKMGWGVGISLGDGLLISQGGSSGYLWCLDYDGFAEVDGTGIDIEVTELLDSLNSYTEMSPSGTGFKTFCLSDKKPATKLKIHFCESKFTDVHPEIDKYRNRAIEVFSKNLFLAITAEPFSVGKYQTIRFISSLELDALIDNHDQIARVGGGNGLNHRAAEIPSQMPLNTEVNQQTIYSRLTKESLQIVLSYIDSDDEQVWSNVSNALARVYGEQGREDFHFYSERSDKYDESECDDRYDRSLSEISSRPNGYGVNHLVKLATSSPSWPNTGLDYENQLGLFDFEYNEEKVNNAFDDYLSSSRDVIPEWQKKYDEKIQQFNGRHASITIGGKHRIKRDTHESIEEVRNIRHEFFTVTDIRSLNSHELVQTGVKFHKDGGETPIMQNIVDAWLKHPDCRRYEDGIVFAPNKKTPNTVFNTWEGFAVEPVKGCKHIPMNEHIEHDICRDNKVLTEYVFNWIAFTYQHPEVPARVALVVRGKKGCGKGTFGHFLMKLWGNHGVHISNSRHLVGQFNAHLGDKCFLFADEAFYSGNKADEPTLKALITEPTMMVERKGIDAQQERNYLKVFMATNSEYAVPASKDERRYCVIDVSDEHIGDKKYFDRLYKACNDKEAQSSFLYEMLNRDISEFNIGDVPETLGLKDQRLHSFDSVQKFVLHYLYQGKNDPLNGWGWVSSSGIYEMYLAYCHSIRLSEHKIQTQNQLSTYLGKVFTAKQKGTDRQRGYEFGSIEAARTAFSDFESVDINWDNEQALTSEEHEEDDYV